MPWPLLLIGSGLLGLTGFVGLGLLLNSLDGKRISIIGGSGVGKSTLIAFLKGEEVLALPLQRTRKPEPYKSFEVRRGNRCVRIKEGVDVPVGANHYRDWKEMFLEADYVLYLVNVHAARESETYKRDLSRDAERMRRWLSPPEPNKPIEPKKPRKLIIVGTHCEKLPVEEEQSLEPPACLSDFRMALGTYSAKSEIIFGSLCGRGKAKRLIEDFLDCVSSDE